MAILLTTGVPAGKAIYAIINNAAGLVYLPGSGAFGAFVNQAGAAVALPESPAGSGRHGAAFPSSQPGEYGVTYYERAGASPVSTDEAYGSETITIGGVSSTVAISVLPLSTDVIGPRVVNQDITVYTSTSEVILFSDLKDRNGDVVNLTGKTLRFAVEGCRRNSPHFQVQSSAGAFSNGFSGGFTVQGGAITYSNGTVAVHLSLDNTSKCMAGSYALRNMTDGVVITAGDFNVERAPMGTAA